MYITAETIHASETYKSEIGSQATMCQIHTGAYTSHYTHAWRNRLYRLPPKKDYHVYITRINSIYHYAYARQTQVNWRKETKKRKEDKGKERKEKKAKQKKNEKGKERKEKDKKSKKRQDKKRKQGKEKRRKEKKEKG